MRPHTVLVLLMAIGASSCARGQNRFDRGETPSISIQRTQGPCIWRVTRSLAISDLLDLQVRDLPRDRMVRRGSRILTDRSAWARAMLLWAGGYAYAYDSCTRPVRASASASTKAQEVTVVRVDPRDGSGPPCHGHVEVTLNPSADLCAHVKQNVGQARARALLIARALVTGATVQAGQEVEANTTTLRRGAFGGLLTVGAPPLGAGLSFTIPFYVTMGHTPVRRVLTGFDRKTRECERETLVLIAQGEVHAEAQSPNRKNAPSEALAWIMRCDPGVRLRAWCQGQRCEGSLTMTVRVRRPRARR